jgi:hypothetical protein
MDCQRLNLTQSQLRQVAVTNLRNQIGQVGVENLADGKLDTPLLSLVTGNDLEACLLLLDEIWEPFTHQVVGEIVVAVPTRDLVYVTGTRSPLALQIVREAIDEAQSHEKTHSLTRHLLLRRGSRWEVYTPKPPALPSSANDDDDRYKPPGDRRSHDQNPSNADSEPPPLVINDNDPEMIAAINEARQRLSEFKALIAFPQDNVSVRVPLINQGTRCLYDATLVGRNGDALEVEIELDAGSPGIRRTYDIAEIEDWTVIKNGHRIGGFTTRVMLKKAKELWGTLPPKLRALEQSFSESPAN